MDLASFEVNGPIPYRPAPEAPKLIWPGGARTAVWIIPNIEWYGLDSQFGGARGVAAPDVKAWSIREYGARVGVWRLMDALDNVGARATVALNGLVCDMYPQVIEAGNQRGWEWMGHGMTNTRGMSGLDEKAEQEVIDQTLARSKRAAGCVRGDGSVPA